MEKNEEVKEASVRSTFSNLINDKIPLPFSHSHGFIITHTFLTLSDYSFIMYLYKEIRDVQEIKRTHYSY